MTVVMRDYQAAVIEEASQHYARKVRRVAIQLATGGGKGRILGSVAQRTAAKGNRIQIVAHRDKLVQQICDNLDDEGVPYGRVQPGWPMLRYPVLVGMVQTVSRRLDKLPLPDLLLIDECHHAPAGQYRAMMEAWPNAKVLGVTATPARSDGQGLRDQFDVLVQGPSMAKLITAGHLANYDYFLPSPDFDAAGIGIQAGDFKPGEALRAMAKAKIVGDAVAHYKRYLSGKRAVAFCMGVQHTRDVASEFKAAGIRAASVDGTMPLDYINSCLNALAIGNLDVLTAADLISEGVDIPTVGGVILLRPTMSVGLYLQQVGRALRPKPDGSRAVILDHVGNARRHGMPADPRAWSLDGELKRDVPKIRECILCFRAFAREMAIEKARAECEHVGDEEDPCPIVDSIGRGGRPIMPGTVAPGELEAAADPWAWAGGCDPVLARGAEFASLVERAITEDQLRMIARARGYKRGWIQHVLRSRKESRVAA